MTEEEKTELRELCAAMVANWEESYRDLINDDFIKLNEETTTTETTEAEILVFDLPRHELHRLHVALFAYDHLIGSIGEEAFPKGSERLCELIVKAREVCPPVRYFDHETPFRIGYDETYWFQWFGKEFLGIGERDAYAFWHKNFFATSHLGRFKEVEAGFPAR